MQSDVINDFLIVDDCALNASTQSLNLFLAACKDLGLTINRKEAEVIYQPAHAIPYTEPSVRVDGEKLAVADKFISLVNINKEVNYRIACASVAFWRLQGSV